MTDDTTADDTDSADAPADEHRPTDEPRPTDEIAEWFGRHLPDDWFVEDPRVLVDRDEILLIGTLAAPDSGDGAGEIRAFRERTRDDRIAIALRAEALYARKVSWGAECGDTRVLFSNLSVPVMTRLRLPERRTLDTLVAAGVARSRSDALAWCVRLVGEHEGAWIQELRDALQEVERVRARRGQ